MGGHYLHDFSSVRVHSGWSADRAAQETGSAAARPRVRIAKIQWLRGSTHNLAIRREALEAQQSAGPGSG